MMGIGIGQFNVAVADSLKAEGKRGYYLQTHNMYTQLSSETGMPGFLLYMAAILHAVGCVRFVRRRAGPMNRDLAMMAACLQGSWILFLTTAIFSSVAYHMQVILLFGLSHAIKTALIAQMAGASAAAPAPGVSRSRVPAAQPVLR